MKGLPIKVKAYSGSRAEERPMSFLWGDQEYKVKEVLETTHEERAGKRTKGFKIRTQEGDVFCLYYYEKEDEWYLVYP